MLSPKKMALFTLYDPTDTFTGKRKLSPTSNMGRISLKH
jgi:hypothetical protein